MRLRSRPVSGVPTLKAEIEEVEKTAERPREYIQSLERGLAIIRAFGPHAVLDGATTAGIARA